MISIDHFCRDEQSAIALGRDIGRRSVLLRILPAAIASMFVPRAAKAFGDLGAFDPRILLTGSQKDAAHPTAPSRWSLELVQRTSAPARLRPTLIRADEPAIVDAPFLYWSNSSAVPPLTEPEILGLRRFFALGGVMLVDDAAPTPEGEPGPFGRSARAELRRVLPESAPVSLGQDYVIFHTFYLLKRAEGRVLGHPNLEAIIRGANAQVIFSSHDIGGALAFNGAGWELPVTPGGETQREYAIRLAINIAMYVLCSNYKDDQVHAKALMRRRASIQFQ